MMRKSLLMTAAAAMGLALGSGAHAQDTGEEAPTPGIGQEVRDTAQSQDKTDEVKGIGQEARDLAQAQDSGDEVDEGETDEDTDDGTAPANQGIGGEVRDLAQDPDREGGIGPEVSDMATDRGDDAEAPAEPETAPEPRA